MQTQEKYLTLSQAVRIIPGNPHPSCVWRWARRGIKTRRGDRVRLTHSRIGNRIFMTEEDLDSFFRAVAEADAEHFDAPPPAAPPRVLDGQERTPEQREAAAAEARASVAHKK